MPDQAQNITSTTQLFLDIHDITNNLVIMKNGTTSIILTVNAMNFGLLAEEEQDGIIYAYAGLLNSLNYPIQIVVRSQTKDVTKYLTLLKDQEEKAPNQLMRQRIKTYREFVSNLIRERNVLDKKFYVVIPASPVELGVLPPQSVLPGSKPVDMNTVEKTVVLEKAKSILEPKRDHLIAQFARIGLLARELETQEIIQLFYISYNPEAAEGQEITDSSSYTTPLVKAGSSDDFVAATPAPAPAPALEPNPAPAVVQEPAPAPAPEPILEITPPAPVFTPSPIVAPAVEPSPSPAPPIAVPAPVFEPTPVVAPVTAPPLQAPPQNSRVPQTINPFEQTQITPPQPLTDPLPPLPEIT